jgi:hypothetical protein
VGDDANLPLLRLLTRNDGLLENVLSTEPTEFKLNAFVAKMNMNPIGQLGLTISPQTSLDFVYPLQDTSFAGSMASWVGQYKAPQKGVGFDVRGVRDGDALSIHGTADLPQKSLEHDQLPRLWAKARVDALLENEHGALQGLEAVIDKDFASSLLARDLKAELFVVSTGVEKVAVDFGKSTERWLDRVTLEEARRYLAEGQFPSGSMGPKIEAVMAFLEGGGHRALITNPPNLGRALRYETGTHLVAR